MAREGTTMTTKYSALEDQQRKAFAEQCKSCEEPEARVETHKDSFPAFQKTEKDNDLLRFLTLVELVFGMPVSWYYEKLFLNADRGTTLKERLLGDGMILQHKVCKKGSGGHLAILEVTDKAKAILQRKGIAVKRILGDGGMRNRFYLVRYLIPYLRRQKWKFQLQRDFENGLKRVDVAFIDSYGRLNAMELVLSGTAQYNCEAAVSCCAIEGMHRVVMLFEDKKLLAEVKKLVKLESMVVQERTSLEWIGDYYDKRSFGEVIDGEEEEKSGNGRGMVE